MSADGHDFRNAQLRDGEAPDRTSHAQRNVLAKAGLRAYHYDDLLETRALVLELLALEDGVADRKTIEAPYRETLDAANSTLSKAGRILEEHGLIQRMPAVDSRKRIWSLTDAGHNAVEEVRSDD